ncbi:MAG: glycosyltransferase family 9 protein, partial [Arcobacter sp.]|nr:glycosyltransferase family 9 protein [Arcobacter sp.]
SSKIFAHHPNIKRLIIDDSKKSGFRYANLFKIAKSVGKIDIAFSFRRNFTSTFLLFFIDAKQKYRYKRYTNEEIHLVIRYNDFINRSLKTNTTPQKLKIYGYEKKENTKLLLGINPGATYGSAKRWYPQEFAKVIIELSSKYDTIIFGGSGEVDMAHDIETELNLANITNYQNLAGLTTVEELIEKIANLDLFITNDSGPMHLAAAFGVPSICIFGPTKFTETSQWQNEKSVIVKKEFSCMPCMKRVCPLGGEEYHQCMKTILAEDVIEKELVKPF